MKFIYSIAQLCTKVLAPRLFNAKALILALFMLVVTNVSAQVSLVIKQSTNMSSVSTGSQFIDTINYSCSSFTSNGQNVVATLSLPENLVPLVISPFASSVAYDESQVASVTYNSATNKITITFVNPLPAGSTGQIQIKFKYINGSTPNGYAPNIIASIDGTNFLDANNLPAGPVYDTVHVTAIAANKYTIGKSLRAGGAINGTAIYKLDINANNSSTGSLNLIDPVLIDTLPAGALFVKATTFNGSNPPVYNATDNTITWTWPANTTFSGYGSSAFVSVTYNQPTFQLNDNVCNRATIKGDVAVLPIGTTSQSSASDSYCFNLNAPSAKADCNGGGISAATASWLNHHILAGTSCNWFRNGWYNSGNTELDEVNLTYTIDKSIDMNSIRLKPVYDGFDSAAPATILVKYATNLNPSFTILGTFQSLSLASGSTNEWQTPTLASGEYLTQVSFKITGSLPIGGYQDLSYCGDARTAAIGAKDGVTPILEGNYHPASAIGDDGTKVYNKSTGSFIYNGNTTTYQACADSAEIIFAQPAFNNTYKSITSDNNLKASDTVNYRFHTYLGGNKNATDVVISDTLNAKLTYVPGSSTLKIGNATSAITPVITSFGAQTVLTYNLGTLVPGSDYYINFSAVIEPGTLPQTIPNKMTLNSSNALFNKTTDPVNLTVISAVALRAFKGQSGCDPAFVYYPVNAVAQEGGPVNYKITLKNLGNVVAKDLVLVDVFPFVSDYRGSAWFANLVGPVTTTDAASKVYYTTVTNPCYSDFTPATNIGSCNTPSWSLTPPADITRVKAIKITRSADLPVLSEIEFTWPMRAPVGVPQGLLMNNSITYQVSRADNGGQLLPSTPNLVGMYTNCTPVLGSLGNYAWVDSNRNGLQDEPAALGLNGIKVYLYGAGADNAIGGSDDVLLDSSVTANDFYGKPGYYKFVELNSGKYYVKFPTSFEQYLSTPVVTQTDKTDGNSDANATTGLSELVTIDATGTGQDKDNTTIDAGYYPLGSLGNYVWTDLNRNGLQDEPASAGINGEKVYLYQKNPSNVYVLVDSTITANNTNGNPGYYNFVIEHTGSYQVKFNTTNIGDGLTTQTTNAKTDGNSDANVTTGYSPVVAMNLLSTGRDVNNPTIDAGYLLCHKPNAGSDKTACGETCVTLTGTDNAFGTWSAMGTNAAGASLSSTVGGVATACFTATASGTYKFIYTVLGGCTDTVNVVVTAKPIAGVDLEACYNNGNGTATLAASGAAGIWSAQTGNPGTSTITTPSLPNTTVVNFSAVGTYKYIYTVGACTDTVNVVVTPNGNIGNYVWLDLDGDGLRNEAASTGVNGKTVELYKDNGSGTYVLDQTTTTANNAGNPGYYNFVICTDGNYKVKFPLTHNTNSLTTQTVTAGTDNNSDADVFDGFSPVVVINTNGTGVAKNNYTIDAGYLVCTKPIAGVDYTACGGSFMMLTGKSTTPGKPVTDGNWSALATNPAGATLGTTTLGVAQVIFTTVSSGTYKFIYITNGGCADTMDVVVSPKPIAGSDKTTCYKNGNGSIALSATGIGVWYVQSGNPGSSTITSPSSATTTVTNFSVPGTYNYIFIKGACSDTVSVVVTPNGNLGNYVWVDTNGDGINNESTTNGINGVTVELWNATTNTFVATTITANKGNNPGYYNFIICEDGNYKVKFPQTVWGGNLTMQIPTANTDNNSDADAATGFSPSIYIDTRATGITNNNPTIDAGYTSVQPANCNMTASIGVNQIAQCVTNNSYAFTGNFTGGTAPYTYLWDLNDGTYAYTKDVTHTYGTSGEHDVTFIVKDSRGCEAHASTVQIYLGAKPKASFNISDNTGSGDNLTFTSTSTISGGWLTYYWNLGNGTTSTLVNPSTTYAPGTYTVTLIATGNFGCSDTITKTIVVSSGNAGCVAPVTSFSINNATQCFSGNAFVFTNASTGTNPTYTWNFGDGTATVSTSSASHTYVVAGTYTVTLTSTNSCGSNTVTKTVVVNGAPILTAPIAGPNSVVVGGLISLTNATFAGTWSSSNTAIATVNANGIVEGLTAGTTTITYTLSNACGTVSFTKLITVTSAPVVIVPITCTAPVADFAINNATQCLSGNAFAFTNASTGTTPNYTWNFGDGSATVSSTNATNTYTSANTYTVTLTATNSCGSNAITKAVTVTNVPVQPAAISGTTSVEVGTTTTLSSATSGGTWSSSNPAIATIDASGLVTGIAVGSSTITYTVTNSCGTATRTTVVTITAPISGGGGGCTIPVANFTINNATQCLTGNAFTFTNTSTGTTPTYTWNFGDGSATVATTNATHSYTSASIYSVSLTATNSCGTNTVTKTVTVNTAPAQPAAISGTPSINIGATTSLSSTTLGGVWSSSNAAIAIVNASGVVTGVSAGTATITYKVTNACGFATSTLLVTVNTNCVPTSSTTNASICSGNTYTFNGTAYTTAGTYTAHLTNSGGCDSSATLVLTVKSSTSSNTSVSICSTSLPYSWNSNSYNAAGTYVVHLTNAAGCDSAATLILSVTTTPTTPATISGASSVQVGNSTTLSSTTTSGVWSSSNTAVATVSNSGIVNGVSAGTATITYTVSNACGTASITKTVTVTTATPVCNLNATFTINNVKQCVTDNQFVFTSSTNGGTAPFTYLWDLNDGTYASTQNVTKTYATHGEHDVTLKVTDANGCVSHANAQQIYVGAKPKASFSILTNTGSGSSTTLISSSTVALGTMSYLWDLGNGQTSTLVNPTTNYSPAPATPYTIKLIVSGWGTCKDTAIQTYTQYAIASVSVYPNPVMNAIQVSFRAASATPTTVKIMDLAGRVLQVQTVTPISTGANVTATLDTHGLQSGSYIVHISDVQNGFLATKAILKQ